VIPEKRRTSPVARVLAPLALIGTAIVVVAVISASTGESDSNSGKRGGGGNRGATTTTTKTEKPPKKYEVQAGDSLSVIADRFGVPVEEITKLNPGIDAQALNEGQTLRLR
jgi:LysM repeat protein